MSEPTPAWTRILAVLAPWRLAILALVGGAGVVAGLFDPQDDHHIISTLFAFALGLTLIGSAVLDARDAYPDSSLADLYDPDTMPPELRRAHKALDKAVDRLYRKKPFDSDRERVEHLFGLYEKLVNPMSDADRQNKRTARNRARKK